jgi:hypothetical protein
LTRGRAAVAGPKPAADSSQKQAPVRSQPRKRKKAYTCADCFFDARGLCALGLDEPCPTFRLDSPEGLVPPRQPTLLMRDPGDSASTGPLT